MTQATSEQLAALRLLAAVLAPAAYLAGGVAVAAHLGHRQSRDLDVFVREGAPEDLVLPLSKLGDRVRVLSRAEGTLYAEVLGVPVSVLRYSYPLLHPPEPLPAFALPIASVDDLICMKLSAISSRGARRDFWDLHAMLERAGFSLEQALALYRQKYPVEDVGHVVRSLVYFADADAEPMPSGLSSEHWGRIKASLAENVQALV